MQNTKPRYEFCNIPQIQLILVIWLLRILCKLLILHYDLTNNVTHCTKHSKRCSPTLWRGLIKWITAITILTLHPTGLKLSFAKAMCQVTEIQSSYIYHSLPLNQLKRILEVRQMNFSYTSRLFPSSLTVDNKFSAWSEGGRLKNECSTLQKKKSWHILLPW